MSFAQAAMKKLEKNRKKKLLGVANNGCPSRFVALMLHSY